MCTHTQAEHAAMKLDGVWESLEPKGFQVGDDIHGDLEMRNASCGSTLARRCMLTPEQREAVREETRQRNARFRAEVALARRAA